MKGKEESMLHRGNTSTPCWYFHSLEINGTSQVLPRWRILINNRLNRGREKTRTFKVERKQQKSHPTASTSSASLLPTCVRLHVITSVAVSADGMFSTTCDNLLVSLCQQQSHSCSPLEWTLPADMKSCSWIQQQARNRGAFFFFSLYNSVQTYLELIHLLGFINSRVKGAVKDQTQQAAKGIDWMNRDHPAAF